MPIGMTGSYRILHGLGPCGLFRIGRNSTPIGLGLGVVCFHICVGFPVVCLTLLGNAKAYFFVYLCYL